MTGKNGATSTPQDPKYTVETARALIRAGEERRARACSGELEMLLKKYNCDLLGAFTYNPLQGPRVEIVVRALPDPESPPA